MLRQIQVRAARKASRKAIIKSTDHGIIEWQRQLCRAQLGLTLAALAGSILLLFIGTYVYFDASVSASSFPPASSSPPSSSPSSPSFSSSSPRETQERTQLYDTILHLYGINETDFSMLFPRHETVLAGGNFKLLNYQIGISMMFVAVVSILIEVGLICAVLFEHLKLSLLYTLIMAAGLIHGLTSSSGRAFCLSLTFQIGFLASFAFFVAGIRAKTFAADRILAKRANCGADIELHEEQRVCLPNKA